MKISRKLFYSLAVLLLLITLAQQGVSLKCWECAGDNCHNVELEAEKLVTCGAENNQCYTGVGLMNGGTVYARACGTSEACKPAGIPWFDSNGVELKDCTLCDQDACNTHADAPIKCYKCQIGPTDTKCSDDNLDVSLCPQGTCSTFEGTLNGTPIMYKECAKHIEHYCENMTQILEDIGFKINKCSVCNTPFCNIKEPEPFSCYSCTGDEAVCNKTSSMHKSVCSEDKPFCFSGLGVNKNGEAVYVRECAKDEGVCPGALSFIEKEGGVIFNCTVCDSHLCNDASTTPEPFSCYSCHENNNSIDCHDPNKMNKRICVNGERHCMSAEEHIFTGVVIVHRDCSLDETICAVPHQQWELKNCTICNSHLCNGGFKTPLECYECAGKYEDCYHPSVMPKKQCGPNDYVCVVAQGITADTGAPMVARGCSPNEPVCEDVIQSITQMGVLVHNCTKCEDGLCNFSKEQPIKCFECKGTISKCHNSKTMRKSSCPGNLCYAGESEINGVKMYARGCADKETFCKDEMPNVINCTVCHTELCNGAVCTDDRCKSLASSISLMPLLMFLTLISLSLISSYR